MTPPELDTLVRLQELDTRIYQIGDLQTEIPKESQKHQAVIAEAEAALTDHLTRIQKDQIESQAEEVLVQSHQESIDKLRGQMNTAGSNKEYTAIQHQIEIRKMELRKAEEAALDAMADTELLLEEKVQIEAKLSTEQAYLKELLQKDSAELIRLDAELQSLAQARQAAAADVEPELLDRYEKILKKNNGLAIVEMSGTSCQGCHMTLTQQDINTLLAHNSIVYCRSCNRILRMSDTPADQA